MMFQLEELMAVNLLIHVEVLSREPKPPAETNEE